METRGFTITSWKYKMNKTLVVGLQYGDEGKGRVSHLMSAQHDWSIRFNGGPNAGHTVYQEDTKFKLHHLPGGSLQGKKVALDAGMVINFDIILKECELVGVKPEDIWVSENVHIIQNKHIEADSDGSGVGSTKRGIAYVYADRALKKGVRIGTYNPLGFTLYKGLPPILEGESALFESAQGLMLDVDYGKYPWTTSSSVFPSSLHKINHRIGVMKAYTSRVGDGPPNFPEMPWLGRKGDEIGTTTGRTRRCYWLIVDEIKYALSIFRPDEIVVTKLDILDDVEEIKVWDNGKEKTIGNINSYKDFLLETFPEISYFSESPKGPMIKVSR